MAKVLACPACGNKHPLDLLVGLDSFLCKECGKKLAVPNEAMVALAKQPKKVKVPDVEEKFDSAISASKIDTPNKTDNRDEIKNQKSDEIVIVARASMAADVANVEKLTKSASSMEAEAVSPKVVAKSQVEETPQNSTAPNSKKDGQVKQPTKMPQLRVPFLTQLIEWAIAIPAGFFLVVLLPRIFGYGFHASDFVGVITNQGLGRYKIVLTLILLWSVASVACLFLFNAVVNKFFFAKKLAV